jgi:hypothetical protein
MADDGEELERRGRGHVIYQDEFWICIGLHIIDFSKEIINAHFCQEGGMRAHAILYNTPQKESCRAGNRKQE